MNILHVISLDTTQLIAIEEQRTQLELFISGVLLPKKLQHGATRNQNALVLLIGPPGVGKSLVIESVLHGFRTGRRPSSRSFVDIAVNANSVTSMSSSANLLSNGPSLASDSHCDFKFIHLDGLLLRSDDEAIQEICEQLSSGNSDYETINYTIT